MLEDTRYNDEGLEKLPKEWRRNIAKTGILQTKFYCFKTLQAIVKLPDSHLMKTLQHQLHGKEP